LKRFLPHRRAASCFHSSGWQLGTLEQERGHRVVKFASPNELKQSIRQVSSAGLFGAGKVRPVWLPRAHLFVLDVAITQDRSAVAQRIAEAYAISPEEAIASPYFVFGTVENVVHQLQESRERYGLSYITIREDHLDLFAPVVERLAGK
jgi:hypothetical protein